VISISSRDHMSLTSDSPRPADAPAPAGPLSGLGRTADMVYIRCKRTVSDARSFPGVTESYLVKKSYRRVGKLAIDPSQGLPHML
jgi:hypothetical protein